MQFIILFGNRKYKVSDREESNQLLDGSVIFNLNLCFLAIVIMHMAYAPPKNNRECNEVKSRSEMMLRNEVLISSGAYLCEHRDL